MKTFSEISKKKEPKPADMVYDGDYIKVKSMDGWEFVEERDIVIIVPHLLEFDEVLLRKEYVPPFNTREPEQEHFLTCISGTMEAGEKPTDTLIREVKEEAGVVLNTGFEGWKKWGKFFMNKGNNSYCHIYYLPITTSDFQKIEPTGDGSEEEAKSNTVRIDLKYLDSLNPSDLITMTVIKFLKEELA